MTIEDAYGYLREAIYFIDAISNCDDYGLDKPNGDSMSIALDTLINQARKVKM